MMDALAWFILVIIAASAGHAEGYRKGWREARLPRAGIR